mgnify:CR=1 FL=1
MAKGYSARGGFSGGGSAMRQQQMQQKLLKMQQDMAAAQEAVENASFSRLSGRRCGAGHRVRQEGADGPDRQAGGRGPGGCGDAAGSGDLCGERGPAPGGRGHEQLHAELHRRSESSWLRTVIPGRKRKGWNRHTIKEAAGRHAVRRVLPAAFAMENASIGRFCHCQHGFWRFHRQCAFRHVLLSPVCFSARFVIASVLFGTFCYRQRTFSARFVMAGTYFRCSLSSSIWLFDVVCDFRNIISCAFCRSCGFLALLLSSSLTKQNRSGQGMSFGYCGSFHTVFSA